MKVVLLQDVKRVGQKGSVAEVANGYAENFLIPRGLARAATGGVLKEAEAAVLGKAGRKAIDEVMARAMLKKLDGAEVTIEAKAGETGTLFQSVHADQVAAAIEEQLGIAVPSSSIMLDGPIKKVGEYRAALAKAGASAAVTVKIT